MSLAGAFELPGGGYALFTSRADGNLSSMGGDGHEHGAYARRRLRETLGVHGTVRGYQVHGTTVGLVPAEETDKAQVSDPLIEGAGEGMSDEIAQPRTHADGYAVSTPGIAAMVFAADCLPIALGAEGAVAAVHAGWRGLSRGVLEEGVRALRELGGRGMVEAVVGPCAGPCCYEVGEEVHAQFAGAHRHGRMIDLRAIAHERLLAAGVGKVRHVQACTICDERYFSYRREGPRAGRQAGLAWLR